MPIKEVVNRVVRLNASLARFWGNSKGWTPTHAEGQLSRARLDWQVGLSRTMRLWVRKPRAGEETAFLILGWSNLGTLVEGSLKLFLAVWCDDYVKDESARKRRGELVLPELMMLDELRQFVVAKELLTEWHEWLAKVQTRRNSIHAFREREIGTRHELREALRDYLRFVRAVNDGLPYPDDGTSPSEMDRLPGSSLRVARYSQR